MEKQNFEGLPRERKLTRREFLKFLMATLGDLLSKESIEEKVEIRKLYSKLSPEYLQQEELELFEHSPETILYDIETLKKKLFKERIKINNKELMDLEKTLISLQSLIIPPKEPEITSLPERLITTKVIYRGPAKTKKISITFDDSANLLILKDLLKFIKENNVKMTWFIIGRTMNREAANIIHDAVETKLVRLGNHSQNHNILAFSKLNEDYLEKEIKQWIETMKRYSFSDENLKFYFRPPGGFGGYRGGNKKLLEILSKNNYQYLVMWDIEFIYTTKIRRLRYTPENLKKIAESRIKSTQGGNIVLAHFNPIDTLAIKNLIRELTQKEYKFVFPEELIQI